MVTQEMLDRLRAERRSPAPVPAPRLDPVIRRAADAQADRDREYQICLGEQRMLIALQQLRAERAQAVLDGYATHQFNRQAKPDPVSPQIREMSAHTQEITP